MNIYHPSNNVYVFFSICSLLIFFIFFALFISDTSKHCDKAEVLLKCSILIDILDSAKNSSLVSQYKDTDIILLVEQIDDMKLSYQLFANKFQASPESVFKLPNHA